MCFIGHLAKHPCPSYLSAAYRGLGYIRLVWCCHAGFVAGAIFRMPLQTANCKVQNAKCKMENTKAKMHLQRNIIITATQPIIHNNTRLVSPPPKSHTHTRARLSCQCRCVKCYDAACLSWLCLVSVSVAVSVLCAVWLVWLLFVCC